MRNRPTAKRQKSEKESTKNRAKINGKSMKNRPETVPGDPRSSSEATGAQKSRKKKQKSRFREPPGDAQEAQKSSKNASKKWWKNGTLKKAFFFTFFFIFRIFQSRCFCIFSYSGDPLVIIFGHFSGFTLFIGFFEDFCNFLKISENEKTRLDL